MSDPNAGKRRGRTRTPHPDDTFLQKICYALDVTPRMLASDIDVPYAELEPLLDKRHLLAEIDRGELWWKIKHHVDSRLAEMMAVRSELNVAMQQHRAARILQNERFATVSARPPPQRRGVVKEK